MPAVNSPLADVSSDILPKTADLPAHIFQHLGQYSPWFAAEPVSRQETVMMSNHCTITFVSQLERHGSRYPTGGAYKELRKTLRQIAKHLRHVQDKSHVNESLAFGDDVADQGLDLSLQWLRSWTDSRKGQDGGLRNRLGNSELTPYGQYEAYASGRRFSQQYARLFNAAEVDVNYDFAGSPPEGKFVSLLCSEDQSSAISLSVFYRVFDYIRVLGCRAMGNFLEPTKLVLERPFVRASGADRVVATSRFWLLGFAKPRRGFQHSPPESAPWPPKGRPTIISPKRSKKPHRPIHGLPEPDVVISEARTANKLGQGASNNSLDVYTCPAFEREHRDNAQSLASRRVASFANAATVQIQKRLARRLGARSSGSKDRRGERLYLSPKQILQLFSLCAFDTVTRLDPYGLLNGNPESNDDAVSPFCGLFEPAEFESIYEMTTNLEKDYGFAAHQPYHKALATSWLRELLARMEKRDPMLMPPTSINTTLDTSNKTFPLPIASGPRAFLDFTHDNQLAPIISALNLWDSTHPWYTSKTTPFSGRLTVEKLDCGKQHGEQVRVLVNDAPASTSQGSWCPLVSSLDTHMCPLSAFLGQLSWVDLPDEWMRCYQ